MSDADKETKSRDREIADEETKSRDRAIADNEAERQTVGDIRVSVWAIAVAVVIGLAAVGWVVLIRNS